MIRALTNAMIATEIIFFLPSLHSSLTPYFHISYLFLSFVILERDIVYRYCPSVCLSVCLSACLSVCLSVRLSHASIVSKRTDLSSHILCWCLVVASFYFWTLSPLQNSKGNPSAGAINTRGVGKFREILSQNGLRGRLIITMKHWWCFTGGR